MADKIVYFVEDITEIGFEASVENRTKQHKLRPNRCHTIKTDHSTIATMVLVNISIEWGAWHGTYLFALVLFSNLTIFGQYTIFKKGDNDNYTESVLLQAVYGICW